MKLTWPAITAWRLERHFRTRPAPKRRWLDVVTAIGGLHAQLMSSAEHALAVRTEGVGPDHVHHALWRDRSLVKTWAMRGTLHLVAARDLPELIGALSTLRHYRRPSWLRYFRVTEESLEAMLAASRVVLTDRGLTREELADALAARTKQPELKRYLRSGWGTLLKPVAFQGHLCFGPSDGQRVTFVNPERWLGRWTPIRPERALAAIARKYLAAYGPARSDDFSRWLGVDAATAKRIFRDLGEELVEVSIDGWKAIMLASSLAALERAGPPDAPPARLLPFFDPYTVAMSRQSEYLFAPRFRAKVYRGQGWIAPVVLLEGRIAGVWEQSRTKAGVAITIEPFKPLSRTAKNAIEAEAERLGAWWGAPVALRYAR